MLKEDDFYLDKASYFKFVIPRALGLQALCQGILLKNQLSVSLQSLNEVLCAIFYYQRLQDRVGINYLPAAFWKPLLNSELDPGLTKEWIAGIEYMTQHSLSHTDKKELSLYFSKSQIKARENIKIKS